MSRAGPSIWFWQRIVSPHMAGLATALANAGSPVTYVAEMEMSGDRAALGWSIPELGAAARQMVRSDSEARALAAAVPADSIHICQGIRSNGYVGVVQRALRDRGVRQWVVMETVDDAGLPGVVTRLAYARLFFLWRNSLEGVLATGHSTADWIAARGMPSDRVYPFAYFLPDRIKHVVPTTRAGGPFRFVFVGQFIVRKRLDLLIRALLQLIDEFEFDLSVIGSGPLEAQLRADAEAALPGRVRWIGRLPQSSIPTAMAEADCLVLPSRHDGWGAVVSEALMVGVPAICSDACGAAAAVRASGVGGVFRTDDEADLRDHLSRAMQAGPAEPIMRNALARWATCLGAPAGAEYLLKIMAHRQAGGVRPAVPWTVGSQNTIQSPAPRDRIRVEIAS